MQVIEIYRAAVDQNTGFATYAWRFGRPDSKDVKSYSFPENWYLQRGVISRAGTLVERLNRGALFFEHLPQDLFE